MEPDAADTAEGKSKAKAISILPVISPDLSSNPLGMEITINQQVKDIPDNSSVMHLIESLLPEMPKGVAVAVNQTIIPRSQWGQAILQPHDKIVFIKATQGG